MGFGRSLYSSRAALGTGYLTVAEGNPKAEIHDLSV
jgi:hypothetical protein